MGGGFSRLISFVLAIGIALFILVGPQFLARSPEQIDHGVLSLSMLGLCLLFVHGVGFCVKHPLARFLLSPWMLWPLNIVLLVWQLF